MKGASKVIMGATLVMVVSLAIVLALVLLLLAELYCNLLLRRRRLTTTFSTNTTAAAATTTATATTASLSPNNSSTQTPQTQNQSPSPPLSSYYTHGVIQAPRNLFFPADSCKEDKVEEKRNQQSQFHDVLEILAEESNASPQQIGLINTSSPASFATSLPHQVLRDMSMQKGNNGNLSNDRASGVGGGGGEQFVYISNPIYDNDACRASRVDTPYETPDSSPSRLETGGGSSGDEDASPQSCSAATPPLTPMKKLPAEACSVSLRDARSLGTSGSDSVSNNGISSSSSGSPCTSPSW